MSSPATKEPTEVFYPQWLDTRIMHAAFAVEAASEFIRRDETFMSVMEESEGDGQASTGAHEVWGADQVLEDLNKRLSAIRTAPAEYADEWGGLVGELWDASHRLSAAALTLRTHEDDGENAYRAAQVVNIIVALADGLNDLGTVYDNRHARE